MEIKTTRCQDLKWDSVDTLSDTFSTIIFLQDFLWWSHGYVVTNSGESYRLYQEIGQDLLGMVVAPFKKLSKEAPKINSLLFYFRLSLNPNTHSLWWTICAFEFDMPVLDTFCLQLDTFCLQFLYVTTEQKRLIVLLGWDLRFVNWFLTFS